ncbi:hypothetical protein D3C85_1248970 [compost metagenome]
MICTCCCLPGLSRNKGGEGMNGTAVVVSSAAVLTQVCTAKGLSLGLATINETLRLSLSNTTRVLLMVRAAWLAGIWAANMNKVMQAPMAGRQAATCLIKPNMGNTFCLDVEHVSERLSECPRQRLQAVCRRGPGVYQFTATLNWMSAEAAPGVTAAAMER